MDFLSSRFLRKKQSSYLLGVWAEYYIILLKRLSFYKILGHRVQTPCGEIDFIAVRGNKVVIGEVKYRTNGDFYETMTVKQIERIRRAASYFLMKNNVYANYEIHFNLYFVTKICKLKTVENFVM